MPALSRARRLARRGAGVSDGSAGPHWVGSGSRYHALLGVHKSRQPNGSVPTEAKAETLASPILTGLQGAFEDELEVAVRSLCRRAICTMSIPATNTNAT